MTAPIDGSRRRSAPADAPLRKRERTRARILNATMGIIARQDIRSATAQEIARQAEIANGTFYLYFRDGEHAVTTAALELIDWVLASLSASFESIDDMAERVGFTARAILDIATQDAALGWALCHAIWSVPEARVVTAARLRGDLLRGRAQGSFAVDVDEGLIAIVSAMVAGAIAARLRGQTDADAGTQLAEAILTMLGVDRARAGRIAASELPPVAIA